MYHAVCSGWINSMPQVSAKRSMSSCHYPIFVSYFFLCAKPYHSQYWVGYEIESQYWSVPTHCGTSYQSSIANHYFRSHWELFPDTRKVTAELVDELQAILMHAAIGTSTLHRPLYNTKMIFRYEDVTYIYCNLEHRG